MIPPGGNREVRRGSLAGIDGKTSATDPICGMQVDERTAAGSSVFEGSNYYFCSAGSKKNYEANPSANVGTPPAGDTKRPEHAHPPAKTRESTGCIHRKPPGIVYTCPMHPEIVRDAPGDCPICGMALVPIAGTGAGQADDPSCAISGAGIACFLCRNNSSAKEKPARARLHAGFERNATEFSRPLVNG